MDVCPISASGVLQRLLPHPSGTGKPIYLLLDPGLAAFFEASLVRRLHLALMNERLTLDAASPGKSKMFYYYRSTGKRWIHWVEETPGREALAWQIHDSERVRETDAELMRAFLGKNPRAQGVVLSPVPEPLAVRDGIQFVPWEELPNL